MATARKNMRPTTVIEVTDKTSNYHALRFDFYQDQDTNGIAIDTTLHSESLEKKFPSEQDKELEKYYISQQSSKHDTFLAILRDISLESAEEKIDIQQNGENPYNVLIKPFNKKYFIKMLDALIKNKIISTEKQLNRFKIVFKIDESEIQKLINTHIKKENDTNYESLNPLKRIEVTDTTSDYYALEFSFSRNSDGIVIRTSLHTESLEKKFPSKQLKENYEHKQSTTTCDKFIKTLINISLKNTEVKTNVLFFKSEHEISITPFSESYFIKMLNALIEDKIISTREQLNDLGKLFKINETAIKMLGVDLYIKKRTDIAAEHIGTFKWLFSCCFFSSTSRAVKLDAAKKLKQLLDEKEVKGQESKIKFSAKEQAALADGGLSNLVTELDIKPRIK